MGLEVKGWGLGSTLWSSGVSLARNFERNMTTFAPHNALKLIAGGKLVSDQRVMLFYAAGFQVWGLGCGVR